MKKIFLIIFLCFFVTGCTSIKNDNIENIIKESLNSKSELYNMKRTGYKYYLPKGMKPVNKRDYNEVLSDGKYKYYMYVDVLSYFKKVSSDYLIKTDIYYSNSIKNDDKFGYLEINKQKSSKYLIEIMYNYAKIEVMVDDSDINVVLSYAISILSSIEYNDIVLDNLLGDNVLYFSNEEFNIFETAKTESNYLYYVEKYDNYDDGEVQDQDFIN